MVAGGGAGAAWAGGAASAGGGWRGAAKARVAEDGLPFVMAAWVAARVLMRCGAFVRPRSAAVGWFLSSRSCGEAAMPVSGAETAPDALSRHIGQEPTSEESSR